MSDPNSIIGKTVGDRFKIIRLIGQGGMGTVYEAEHRTLPRKFAVKILRHELANERDIERFRREAIASARLEHPNIIYITDFGETKEGALYLVMEYLEGIGLDEILSRHIRLPLSRALPILAQIADALDHAHYMKVIHRDLKPENILLTEVRGRKDVVKLLDFGIAKLQTKEFSVALTIQGQVFGTAEYMSPEQATGENVDGRSDIYAVGCLGYELITGDPPFLGPPLKVLQSHVGKTVAPPSKRLKDQPIPSAVDAVILRCLKKDPGQRYQTASELRQDLLKVRALLFTLGSEHISKKNPSGMVRTVPEKKMTEGWHAIGGNVPELLISPDEEPMHPRMRLPTNPERLQDDFREALRELAFSLVQAALAPTETTEVLERLLVVEEEVASLTGTIALTEQNFDRIRFEFSQREKKLRYAILDLNMENTQLQVQVQIDPKNSEQINSRINDLNYQIGELTKRCDELEIERSKQIQELDNEIKAYEKTTQEREEEATQIYQSLHKQIESLRLSANTQSLAALYTKLDQVRNSIGEARSVG